MTTDGCTRATWPWARELTDFHNGIRSIAPPDEARSIDHVAKIIAAHGEALAGCSVLDFGCGRGACSEYACLTFGVRDVMVVDIEVDACRLATAVLRLCEGVRLRALLSIDGVVGADDGTADIVWSFGVIEHVRPHDIQAYVTEAVRLSRRWVVFVAPNPLHEPYLAFREHHLKNGSWIWGFEEPLVSYRSNLEHAGADVVYDDAPPMTWDGWGVYARQVGDVHRWTGMFDSGHQGPMRLIVARKTLEMIG